MKTSSFNGIAAVLLLSAMALAACKPQFNEESATTIIGLKKVKIQKLQALNTPLPITASGKLASKSQTQLSFKIGGIVDQIFVNEGQHVKKGHILARLNLTEINAQVMQAKNNMEKTERDLTRTRNLYKDTVATLEQMQDATTVFEIAKAGYQITIFNQKHAKIIATENGKILKKFVEEAELVAPGQPIFTLGSNGTARSYLIKIGIADKDVVKVNLGDSARVFFDAYPGTKFTASVTEIAEAADPLTGAFEIELTLSPNKNNLKNGFIGKVTIYPTNQTSYYKISMNALVEGDQSEVNVFIPNQNNAKKIKVRPDYIGDDYFTVLSSEWIGEKQVITDGSAYLKEGESFSVIN